MGCFNQETASCNNSSYVWADSDQMCGDGQRVPVHCPPFATWLQKCLGGAVVCHPQGDWALCAVMKDIQAWGSGAHKGRVSSRLLSLPGSVAYRQLASQSMFIRPLTCAQRRGGDKRRQSVFVVYGRPVQSCLCIPTLRNFTTGGDAGQPARSPR